MKASKVQVSKWLALYQDYRQCGQAVRVKLLIQHLKKQKTSNEPEG
jgi:hypothetical protein